MNGLLNRAPNAPIGPIALEPVSELPYTLEELTEQAAQSRDEVRLAKAGVERADAAIRAELAGLPDDELTYRARDEIRTTLEVYTQTLAGAIGKLRVICQRMDEAANPGAGAATYGLAQRMSPQRDEFGRGASGVDGMLAPSHTATQPFLTSILACSSLSSFSMAVGMAMSQGTSQGFLSGTHSQPNLSAYALADSRYTVQRSAM